jgi:hypothetical protein
MNTKGHEKLNRGRRYLVAAARQSAAILPSVETLSLEVQNARSHESATHQKLNSRRGAEVSFVAKFVLIRLHSWFRQVLAEPIPARRWDNV